jgi:hypothetical protein
METKTAPRFGVGDLAAFSEVVISPRALRQASNFRHGLIEQVIDFHSQFDFAKRAPPSPSNRPMQTPTTARSRLPHLVMTPRCEGCIAAALHQEQDNVLFRNP